MFSFKHLEHGINSLHLKQTVMYLWLTGITCVFQFLAPSLSERKRKKSNNVFRPTIENCTKSEHRLCVKMLNELQYILQTNKPRAHADNAYNSTKPRLRAARWFIHHSFINYHHHTPKTVYCQFSSRIQFQLFKLCMQLYRKVRVKSVFTFIHPQNLLAEIST